MWSSAFFAFLHFAAVFCIFCTVFYEWMAFSRAPQRWAAPSKAAPPRGEAQYPQGQAWGPTPITLEDARRIQQCDRWYGACAVALLAIGFLRVVYFEKGAAFYFASPFFHLKIGLFVLVGLLSIYPTLKFIGWGKATRQGQAPVVSQKEFTTIRRLLGLELLLLFGVALCASPMARGLGF